MDDHAFCQGRIPLLPDADLLRLIDEITDEKSRMKTSTKSGAHQSRLARRVEAISREIRARGLTNPPWWSVKRDWEIEDLPVYAGTGSVYASR